MTPDLLSRFNRIFGDRLGHIPHGRFLGQPLFQWKESKDLLYLVRKGTRTTETKTPAGIILQQHDPICEWERQRDEDGWVLAKWIDPPDKIEWEEKYGSDFGWPKDGYWFSIVPVLPGEEPTERMTHRLAEQMVWQRTLGFKEHLRLIEDYKQRKEEQTRKTIAEMIDDSVTYHVPGARGGSYSVPGTKFN